jgi:hypothetical protein
LSNIKPLPVYPRKPVGAVLEALKQAKAKLPTGILITPENAVPGSPGRVLAIGEKPNFLCDYAYVKEPTVESLEQALAWCLELKEDTRGVTIGRMLSELWGGEVKEIANNSNQRS